jgi:hypothetical protein
VGLAPGRATVWSDSPTPMIVTVQIAT